MSLFLAKWHLGQDDKITLKLYTNVYIFKVTFNQERWQYVRCSVRMLICQAFSKDYQSFNIIHFKKKNNHQFTEI